MALRFPEVGGSSGIRGQWAGRRQLLRQLASLGLSDHTYSDKYLLVLGLPHRPLPVAPVQYDLLGVYGVLFPETGMATIHVLQHCDGGAAIPDLVPGDYCIRPLDSQGEFLADHAFTPTEESGEEQDAAFASFAQIVDWVDGASTVQIFVTEDERLSRTKKVP